MPELTVDPTEWSVVVHRQAYAIIRRVSIDGEEYWRVVTGEDDRARRRLVGYWGSFEEAAHNALAFVEQELPSAWLATGTSTRSTPRTMTPQQLPRARRHDATSRGIPDGVDTVWGAPRRR